jgi:hypothetical protein
VVAGVAHQRPPRTDGLAQLIRHSEHAGDR